MAENEQGLRLTAKAEGFDEAAKETKKVTDATSQLTDKVKEGAEAAIEFADGQRKASDVLGGVGSNLPGIAFGFAKIALVLRTVAGAFKRLPAASAAVAGITSIIQTLRSEIRERERLIHVMRIQGRVADELQQKHLAQKDTLERVAGTRRIGGFRDAATASRVQSAKMPL